MLESRYTALVEQRATHLSSPCQRLKSGSVNLVVPQETFELFVKHDSYQCTCLEEDANEHNFQAP